MSEITIMGCDGCRKAATARRPVHAVVLTVDGDADMQLQFDAHDNECIRRFFSHTNKVAKDAAKAQRAEPDDTPRGKPAKK